MLLHLQSRLSRGLMPEETTKATAPFKFGLVPLTGSCSLKNQQRFEERPRQRKKQAGEVGRPRADLEPVFHYSSYSYQDDTIGLLSSWTRDGSHALAGKPGWGKPG